MHLYFFVTAPLPAPTILTVSSPTPTSIFLTWDQPEGSADAVDRYQINYNYSVEECSSEGSTFPTVIVILNNGSLRSYNLINSSFTPVEEDGIYFISLTAMNSVTLSDPTEAFPVDTANAGN